MTPEVGAVFLKAIALMREHIPAEPVDENGPADRPPDHAATNIDALAMMVESFLANAVAARNGGDRYQIVINADADVLSDDADGTCELDNGPALAPETVRRLACDASIVNVTTDGDGGVIQVGDKAPAIPAATRRAVHRRDGGCRFPGCSARAFTNIHHLHHRAQGGSNDHRNLLELCWHHHRLVHEGGWNVDSTTAAKSSPSDPTATSWNRPLRLAGARTSSTTTTKDGITIDPTTCIPRCYGDKLDLDHIITGLLCIDHPELIPRRPSWAELPKFRSPTRREPSMRSRVARRERIWLSRSEVRKVDQARGGRPKPAGALVERNQTFLVVHVQPLAAGTLGLASGNTHELGPDAVVLQIARTFVSIRKA